MDSPLPAAAARLDARLESAHQRARINVLEAQRALLCMRASVETGRANLQLAMQNLRDAQRSEAQRERNH